MSTSSEWEIPQHAQPRAEDWPFDLERALSAVLMLRATIPADAFTASTLGTERGGNAVVIRGDGLVLTIGYLITEADTIWLNTNDGRAVPGHVLAYDQETGFGLVQALGRLNLPALPLGRSARLCAGDRVIVAGGGGRAHAVSARIASKQEFAGYWEYLLEEAIFTSPAHPNWGGAALIAGDGSLAGIGSLHLQQARDNDPPEHLNMIVPIDLLMPIMNDLLTIGRPNHPPRPWIGLYATEVEDKIVVAGLSNTGPGRKSGLRMGDIVLSVGGHDIKDLASLYRSIWSCGPAGVRVPFRVYRDGRTLDIEVKSADRSSFLKSPSVH